MAFRPAGFSDDEGSDDEFLDDFTEKRVPQANFYQERIEKERKINTALQDAIDTGDLGKLKQILVKDLNKNPNARLHTGWTLLMHACHNAQHDIVEYLLACDADVNQHCDSVTPMMVLCSCPLINSEVVISIMYSLLEKGAHIGVGDKYGTTPLMKAIEAGNVKLVEELLKQHLNIEMRDQQGWTAAFWAVHRNQPKILEMLIAKGCRLNEVDRSGRTPLEIAQSHDHEDIIQILKENLNLINNNDTEKFVSNSATWLDFYPGVNGVSMPSYKHEIVNLLYGMNCERLASLFHSADIDLRTFLLLDDEDMMRLGIEMPYERKRLQVGLRQFHTKAWKLNSVAGLYAKNTENYSVLDCLTSLSSHLYQIYILEASLQYTIRCLEQTKEKLKFEPENSPLLSDLNKAANNIAVKVDQTRNELQSIKKIIDKRSKDNPPVPELIRPRRRLNIITQDTVSTIMVCCAFASFIYGVKLVVRHHVHTL